jgi:hypothetical protein
MGQLPELWDKEMLVERILRYILMRRRVVVVVLVQKDYQPEAQLGEEMAVLVLLLLFQELLLHTPVAVAVAVMQ